MIAETNAIDVNLFKCVVQWNLNDIFGIEYFSMDKLINIYVSRPEVNYVLALIIHLMSFLFVPYTCLSVVWKFVPG